MPHLLQCRNLMRRVPVTCERGDLGQATVTVDDLTVRLSLTADAADAERLLH